MPLLSFLSKASVEEVKSVPKTGAGGPKKQRNPNPAILAIRLWRDGSVYPSEALVDKFNLEYPSAVSVAQENIPLKEGETEQKTKRVFNFANQTGNGFDVINTKDWVQWKADGDMLFVGLLPKDAGKVDLFQSTVYNEDGTPKSSVIDQGTNTFGKEQLIPFVEDLYGITFYKPAVEAKEGVEARDEVPGVEFVDLEITSEAEGVNVTELFSKPITLVSKKITRGEDKGKSDYSRRENMKLYALIPLTTEIEEETIPEAQGVPVELAEAEA